MLIQFTVENYLSIHSEQSLSMLAVSDDHSHSNHLVSLNSSPDQFVLRAAAVYGPNGAGKSNLVKAMWFARELILTGTRSAQSIPVRPFRLSPSSTEQPTKIQFIFQAESKKYTYGFRASTQQILDEWLYCEENNEEYKIFERHTLEDSNVNVDFGERVKANEERNAPQFLDFVAKGTRPNQLFLTEAEDRNVKSVEPVISWFLSDIIILSAEPTAIGLETMVATVTPLNSFATSMLQSAGIGVRSLNFEVVPFEPTKITGIFDAAELDRRLQELGDDSVLRIIPANGQEVLVTKGNSGDLEQLKLMLEHSSADGKLVSFSVNEESDGTQRLLNIIPALFALRNNVNKVVILDELDRRFHTHLSRMIVEAALSASPPENRCQFIFTTHDTNLLDLGLLRKDEIWFVEKDAAGSSHLYSLAEFKLRSDIEIEKGYLNGRFGAIPFVADVQTLGWGPNGSKLINSSKHNIGSAGRKRTTG